MNRLNTTPDRNSTVTAVVPDTGGVTGNGAEQPRWYALHTRCNHEKRVAAELKERGLYVFLPLIRDARRWSDRRKIVEMPLFSCYVFLRIAVTAPTRIIALQAPGVLSFVSFNTGPAAIPDAQIEAVRTALAGRASCSPYTFLKVGQKVRIRGGSLDGVEGILVGRNGDRRVVISIDIIQQAMAITVEGYNVEPV